MKVKASDATVKDIQFIIEDRQILFKEPLYIFTPFSPLTDTEYIVDVLCFPEIENQLIEYLESNWESLFKQQLTHDQLRTFMDFSRRNYVDLFSDQLFEGEYRAVLCVEQMTISNNKFVPLVKLHDYAKRLSVSEIEYDIEEGSCSESETEIEQILEEYQSLEKLIK